jgi:hypothetical protein
MALPHSDAPVRHHGGGNRTTERPRTVVGDALDGRSPGLRVSACILPSQSPSGTYWSRLTAYSCGGSQGFVHVAGELTLFPFHPQAGEPSSP